MLLSFVLAFVINYLLNPFTNALERAGLARKYAVGTLYVVFGLIAGLSSYFLLPHISCFNPWPNLS